MKIHCRVARSAICLAQTLLLLAGNCSSVYAASSTSQLDGFETSVFGETHTKLSEDTRLKDLEINLFGKARTGSNSSRLAEIGKSLGGGKGNLLLPPIAPQLDTSRPSETASAPSYSSGDDNSASANSGSSQEKDTLRNAMQLYSQGRTDEAERLFRKVLSMNIRNADAYYNLGVIAESKGDLQGALSNYKSAARINPNDADLTSAISGIQTKLQDKVADEQRQKQIQQQAALEAQQQHKTENLKQMIGDAASAYKAGNYDKAISSLQYVSQQAPNDPDVLYALGQAYKGKGDTGRARSIFNQAIAIDPGNQLYKNALADLNNVASNSGSSSGYDNSSSSNYPPTAPAYGSSSPFTGRSKHHPGQLTGFAPDNSSSGSAYGGNDTYASQGAGQLTPFSGIAEKNDAQSYGDGSYSDRSNGYSSGGGLSSLAGSFGGLGMSSLLGGGLGSMLGGGVRYNGYSSYGRSGGTTYRLKRVAIGSLGGAAAGALYGSMSHGSVKSSALRGALMGGAMSLFMGF